MARRYKITNNNSDLTGGNDFNYVLSSTETSVGSTTITQNSNTTRQNYAFTPPFSPGKLTPRDLTPIVNNFIKGFDSTVNAIAIDSNGKIYVGGGFTTYKGVTNNRIIRLNSDGSKDTIFDNTTGFGNTVNAIAIDSNGKIYVGGDFTTYKGVTNNYIIRLNPDGSKDTAFDNTTGFNSSVNTIAIDSNGKIYVGGAFTSYKGVANIRIIRLNPDGSKDTGFDNTTGFGNTVRSIAIDSNGKIYMGGFFTTYKSVANNYIIRLNPDGSKDTGFDNTTGFGNTVTSIAIDSFGKIYVGGDFTTYKGVTETRIIRLNPDGSKDTAFNNTTGFNSTVLSITIDSNGKIYVVGSFTTYKGVNNNCIIRLNPDGSKDTGFDNTSGFNNQVNTIAIDSNGRIYVGGVFNTYKGNFIQRFLILSSNGLYDIDDSFNFGDTVNTITIDSNGKIYVGGTFSAYKGIVASRIIRLNADGSRDTGFDNTTGFNSTVNVITIDTNGKIYIGGAFTTYKGVTENRIIRLNPDGSKDTGFDNTTGFGNTVNAIAIDSNGKIYVGGQFTTYKGVTNNCIIRLNPDGSKDTAFDNTTGFGTTVSAIAVDSNGKIYVGGQFTTYKGVAASRIIRLNADGSRDTGFDNTTGFGNTVNVITIDSNGKIYVGGLFTTYKAVTNNYIIRLNPDGSKDTSFDNTTGFNLDVTSIAIDSFGKIYVGGLFTTYKGVTETRIIRLNPDGSKDTAFDNTTGFNNTVNVITIDSNGKIYVGGAFTAYKNVIYTRFIVLNNTGAPISNNVNELRYKRNFGFEFNTTGFNSFVNAIAIDSNGKIYVGGDFTAYNGATNNRIIRLNPDGSKDTGFDNTTGFNIQVRSIVIDSNGKIYVGGLFTTYKGVTENRIIRLNPDGSKDTGFDNTTGFDNSVNVITIDSNGKIYVGGAFTAYKGVTNVRIIRLNPDGGKDTGFDNTTGFGSIVNAIAIDSSGKIYVGGQFTTYKGVTNNRIIRLNADGSRDTGFDNTTGFGNTVNAIAIDSSGKIYVGGAFTTYKGVTNNYIIRLNPDGSKDTGFDNTTGFSTIVLSITIDSNGKIYVGGGFTTYKGVANTRIIRLNPDGNKDTGFDNATGFDNSVNAIAIDSNGRIYVGGIFTTYKGEINSRIIRLNPDGFPQFTTYLKISNPGTDITASTQLSRIDENGMEIERVTSNTLTINEIKTYRFSFGDIDLGAFSLSNRLRLNLITNLPLSGLGNTVNAIAIDSNGKIYVGGDFTTYKGVNNAYIIRLNPDGSKDTGFDNTTGFGNTVNAIAIDSNGKIYVGGFFTTYKSVAANRIIRLNADGSKDTAFDNITGFDNSVNAIAIDSNGKIYVGGVFTSYKGVTNNRIIRLNPDGSKDTSFDNTTGFNLDVTSIAIDSFGKIYVGGIFTTYKGVTNNRIIRLNPDGSKDTAFDNTTGFDSTVNAIAEDSNGKIYVGGQFTTYKGVNNNRIIRLNPNGSKDTAFDNTTGFNGIVNSITIDYLNGIIYVGGAFGAYKGATNNGIIRLNSDGSKDTGFDNTTGFNGTVRSIVMDSFGDIYMGGSFTSYKGVTENRIIRLNPDGSKDSIFNIGGTESITIDHSGSYIELPFPAIKRHIT
jgi:uncharacterized delta-60 repeat protein